MGRSEGSSTPFSIWKSSMACNKRWWYGEEGQHGPQRGQQHTLLYLEIFNGLQMQNTKRIRVSKKRCHQYCWGYEIAFLGPDPTIFNFFKEKLFYEHMN